MFSYSLPWNQHTLIGYFGETFATLLIGEAYGIANGSLLLLFVSLCMHHQAFYQMFQYSTSKLESRNAQEQLCKLIRFHSSVKE